MKRTAPLVESGRRTLRTWVDVAREIADIVHTRLNHFGNEPPYPPKWLRDVGPGDFGEPGKEFLSYFIELALLRPEESVLDIGCGSGRMALPLMGYLHEGRYVGVDITAKAIRWCRRNISSRAPHFDFHHADIFNRRYNPGGKIRARDYVFPFGNECYDFIFLTSVFTHMLPDDIKHYLDEIARLLRPKGRMFATFFLLNPLQRKLARQKRNEIDFRYGRGIYRIRDEAIPESAVAIEEVELRHMLDEAGLKILEPIRFGHWSGRPDGLSFQDIVLAEPCGDDTEKRVLK